MKCWGIWFLFLGILAFKVPQANAFGRGCCEDEDGPTQCASTLEKFSEREAKREAELDELLKKALLNLPRVESERITVVFDIDNTAVEIDPRTGAMRRISQVFTLYWTLRSRGYEIVFLSANPEYNRGNLEVRLDHFEFRRYEGLVLMSDKEHKKLEKICNSENLFTSSQCYALTGKWKAAERAKLIQKGYRIAATVDDRPENLEGDHTGHPILIPLAPVLSPLLLKEWRDANRKSSF